ncbi:uncharacterized protein LOC131242777 isoform X2 [Magnolia sinica]|uniref:uncharacterized protein LOC131242777 isoform X2 n=1 Tax=Magnolia sinica TaxID=86752 RepID=UPI0026589EAD|nr:uncharacterized protein LOC131242777 isoform X2 [Magnolia sinica]
MQGASLLNSSVLLPSKHTSLIFPLSLSNSTISFPSKTLKSPKPLKTLANVSADQLTTTSPLPASSSSIDSASDVVRKFYDGINGRDLASVDFLIAENCVYEDLIFSRPFVGRKAILEFFQKFIDSISADLQFAIDDISSEDSLAVGVTWHLDWKGRPFPFSKGCSFYRLEVVNGKRQIIYGRDSVEPAIKPGELALGPLGVVLSTKVAGVKS